MYSSHDQTSVRGLSLGVIVCSLPVHSQFCSQVSCCNLSWSSLWRFSMFTNRFYRFHQSPAPLKMGQGYQMRYQRVQLASSRILSILNDRWQNARVKIFGWSVKCVFLSTVLIFVLILCYNHTKFHLDWLKKKKNAECQEQENAVFTVTESCCVLQIYHVGLKCHVSVKLKGS